MSQFDRECPGGCGNATVIGGLVVPRGFHTKALTLARDVLRRLAEGEKVPVDEVRKAWINCVAALPDSPWSAAEAGPIRPSANAVDSQGRNAT